MGLIFFLEILEEKTRFPHEMHMHKKKRFCDCNKHLQAPRWASPQRSDEAGFLLDGEPIATEQLDILYVIVAEEAELDFT